MAKGTNLTVSWYDAEELIRAWLNNDKAALDKVMPNIVVDFETATAA